jgi:hypothetical protein
LVAVDDIDLAEHPELHRSLLAPILRTRPPADL